MIRALFIDVLFMISLFLTLVDELISHSQVISRPARVVIGKASNITNDFNLFNLSYAVLSRMCLLPQITCMTHGDDDDYEGIISTANLRDRRIVGRKKEGRNRLTVNLDNVKSRSLNIIIIIVQERNPPFVVAVSPRTLSAVVEGERTGL